MANTKITTNVIADGAITSAKLDTNITISGNITGTLATAAQPNITSVGTLTGFTSTGIDDNATSTAITIDSSQNTQFAGTAWLLDGKNIYLGTDGDMRLRHDNSNGYIDCVTGSLILRTGGGATEAMRIDSSGNVGIGTVPESWNSAFRALDIGVNGALISQTASGGDELHLISNGYYDGAWKYKESNSANQIILNNGAITFEKAASGTANAALTWQETMRIDSSGNVGIGASTIANESDHHKLKISGASGTGAGMIEFADGSNNIDAAIFSDDGNLFIVADRDNTAADSSIRFRVDGSSEKMRIDSGGRVMIAETSNSGYSGNADDLIVGNNGAATERGISIGSTAGGGIRWNDGSDAGIIQYAHSSNAMQFYTANSLAATIDSSGAVGIGVVPQTNRFAGHDVLQIGARGTLLANDTGSSTGQTALLDNLFYNSAGNFRVRDGSNATAGVAMQFVEGNVIFSNSAATTGDPTVSERMRIDSSGKVGIGTAPSEMLHIKGGGNGPELRFENASTSHYIRAYNNNWNFLANGTTAMTIKDSGQVNFGAGLGIGGTGTANTLDIYEEGTWTPASGTTGVTIQGSPSGTYTKIGRMVHYTFSLKCNKTGSGSAQVTFTGLPFSGTGGILQFTRFEPTGIAYQWINGTTSGTTVYLTRPAGTAPGTSGGVNNNSGQVLKIDDISGTTNDALQNVSGYGWYSV